MMKKTDSKKILVRNPEVNLKKAKVTVPADTQRNEKNLPIKTHGKSVVNIPKHDSNINKANKKLVSLDTPEFQSTLKLSKQIDQIINPRKTKSLSDVVDEKKLAVDEKVSRKVNFPYDQAIFKDLIPLTCDKVQSQPTVVMSRPPVTHRDKEPVLEDFTARRKTTICCSLPTVRLENPSSFVACDNFRLYRLLEKN